RVPDALWYVNPFDVLVQHGTPSHVSVGAIVACSSSRTLPVPLSYTHRSYVVVPSGPPKSSTVDTPVPHSHRMRATAPGRMTRRAPSVATGIRHELPSRSHVPAPSQRLSRHGSPAFPHTVPTGSKWHEWSQQSPSVVFPSSHSSPAVTTPSPQTGGGG